MVKGGRLSERLTLEKEHYLAFSTAFLCDRAKEGSLVYHGRTGHLLLSGVEHRLRVRVVADPEFWLRAVMRDLGSPRDKARRYIGEVDEDRRRGVHTVTYLWATKGASMDRPLSVLILDDEPIVGKRLKPAIEKVGFEVETFEDPAQALRRLGEREFDIVVTDVRMEEVSGIQVLEHVLSRSRRTKVIIITGYATVEVAREALVKGAFEFLAKPFKPSDLRAVLDRAARALGHPGIPKVSEE